MRYRLQGVAWAILMYIVFTGLLGCGTDSESVRLIEVDEENCTVEVWSAVEVRITCPDGSQASIFQGKDGADGQDGEKGEQGERGARGPKGETLVQPGKLAYIGAYCGKTVLEAYDKLYIINGTLIQLNEQWLKVSNTCQVRYIDGDVEFSTP